MHEEGLVHGDLKGVRFLTTWSPLHVQLTCSQLNILINNSGHACLADFGLATIASDQSIFISSCVGGGTIQWMSPELLDPGRFGFTESRPTKESDCYALGMVIYEVLSGHAPFAPFRLTPVIWKVLNGERPERSQGKGGALFPDDLWGTLELCWKHQPGDRINAKVVLQCLERTPSLPRSSFDAGGVVGTGTDGLSGSTARNSGTFLFSIPSESLRLTSSRLNAKVDLRFLERTSSLLRPLFYVGGVAGTGTDGQPYATASNSGMFSFSIPSESLRLTSRRLNAKVDLEYLERTSSLPRSPSDVGGVAGTGTDGQPYATASNSGMFLFSIPSVSLSLTSSRPRGIIDPTITRSGNGLLVSLRSLRRRAIATITRSGDGLVVPSRSLRRHVATVSGPLPSPHSNPQAHPNCLPGTTGLPVPQRGHPSDITSSTTPPDGGKLPAPPWQGRARKGFVSRLMHKARGKLVETSA